MRQQPLRSGFSRWELLAVVTIIGFLVALTLPAIQASREAARRAQCQSNLKQICLGLLNYHDTYNVFPMGAMHSGPNPGGAPPVNAALGPSWWYGLLPFVEQSCLPDELDGWQRTGGPANRSFCARDVISAGVVCRDKRGATTGPFGSPIHFMRCPASPLPSMETPTGPICLPSYVGIAGGCDIDPASEDYPPGLVTPTITRRYRNWYKATGAAADGVVTSRGMLPPCEHARLADCVDGSFRTLFLGEQSDWLLDQDQGGSGRYHGDAGWTVGGTAPGGGWLSGTTRVDPVPKLIAWGGPREIWGADCWNITTVRYPPNYKRVMGTRPLPGCSENHGINNPLQSAHPGGVLVGFVDEHVDFVSEGTDLAVLLRCAIRDDGQFPLEQR